jgi:hypothetical protein
VSLESVTFSSDSHFFPIGGKLSLEGAKYLAISRSQINFMQSIQRIKDL